jgi:hypothetical protein
MYTRVIVGNIAARTAVKSGPKQIPPVQQQRPSWIFAIVPATDSVELMSGRGELPQPLNARMHHGSPWLIPLLANPIPRRDCP